MNTMSRWMVVLALVSTSANGQESPNTVGSDDCEDTAMGLGALGTLSRCTGQAIYNTAAGALALSYDTTGYNNTAFGGATLYANQTGANNTAVGGSALYNNLASNNSALGLLALYENQTGSNLTAVGANALEGAYMAATGSNNTAVGAYAMNSYSSGADNTAAGAEALYANTTGANNTAFGYLALYSNTVGKGNAAQGVNAMYSNTTGIRNLGIGSNALYDNVTGSYNVALGFDAGYDATGNDNIYINNLGVGGESQTLRLGTPGTAGVVGSGILTAYVAGVATSPVTGSAVYVTSSGQLGVLASSERFKQDIETMPSLSEKLAQLRPVTFKYRNDASRTLQYGLIAEEVAKVYPELVIRDQKGETRGVRYEELAPMLLSEMQKQQRINATQAQSSAEQAATIGAQASEILALKQQVAKVNDLENQLAEMRTALAALKPKDHLVARR